MDMFRQHSGICVFKRRQNRGGLLATHRPKFQSGSQVLHEPGMRPWQSIELEIAVAQARSCAPKGSTTKRAGSERPSPLILFPRLSGPSAEIPATRCAGEGAASEGPDSHLDPYCLSSRTEEEQSTEV